MLRNNIFCIGGNGRLAQEIRKYRPKWRYLSHMELDVTCPDAVNTFFNTEKIDFLLHLAAATDVVKCESDHNWAYSVNVVGTRNIVKECLHKGIFLIYTSTDAVFFDNGPHKEDDPVNPANYYSLTKALGEESVRCIPQHLITRSTLKERGRWHPIAPTDMWQTITFYDEYAPLLISLVEKGVKGTVHIGGQHWNVYKYAKEVRPDVKPVLRKDLPVPVPRDCRLDTSKLKKLQVEYDLQARNENIFE